MLNTTHETGQRTADAYIRWYNRHKFNHMPVITGVHKNEVDKMTKVPKIGNKYSHLRPTPVLPEEEDSEPEVEDESPDAHTTGEEQPPPIVNVDNGEPPNPSKDSEDNIAKSAVRKGGLFHNMPNLETFFGSREEPARTA